MMTEEFKKLLVLLISHNIPFYFSPPNQYGGGYVYGYKRSGDTIYNRIWEVDDATRQDNVLVFFDPKYDDVGEENLPAEEMIKYILEREYCENGVDYNE